MVHVPYRGSTPAITDLIGGQVQVMFDVTPTAVPQVKAGRTRALGVSTVDRLAVLPDVPPIGDFVKGYEASAWVGVAAPKDTPPDVVAVLHEAVNEAVGNEKVRQRLADLGATPMSFPSPADFARYIRDDVAKWAKLIKATGMKPG
jgi:tripartite-type tricarboxylate transporter receptor subunit TctC